jgi:hypothetical protein
MLDLPWLDIQPGPYVQAAMIENGAPALAPAVQGGAFQLMAVHPRFAICRLWLEPRVWLIEFADLGIQALAMNRMAHVLEGRTAAAEMLPREAAVSAWFREQEVDPVRLRVEHDDRLGEVQGFFERAQIQGLALNAEEQVRRDDLGHLGLLGAANGPETRAAKGGAVIALARASALPSVLHLTPAEYRAVLRHELSHAELLINPAYRAYCIAFWRGLSEPVRASLRKQFICWHYDPKDTARLAGELQAYLWEVELGGFLEVHLRRAGTSLAALRTAFLDGLDIQDGPAAQLFRLPGMREPLARGVAWSTEAQLVKRVEEPRR